MLVRKTSGYRDFIKDELHLYKSTISLDISFYDVDAIDEDKGKYRIIFIWVHPCGNSVKNYVSFHTSIHSNNLDELQQFFMTMAILMEKQNGVVSITQDHSISPEIARLVEKIAEDVSMLVNTVFWYCIKSSGSEEKLAAKRYFDYLGVTEEEWLLLG